MLCVRAGWLVSQCNGTGGGSDGLDVNCACSSRVLENRSNQGLVAEYRSSLAGAISPDTVICWRVLSSALSARPIAMWVRKTGGLGRHRCCRPSVGCGWRETHSIHEVALAYLEHDWTYRHHFRCL